MFKKRLLVAALAVFTLCLLLGTMLSGCSSDRSAEEGDKVRVDYTLFLSDGTEYETSVGKEPLEFVIGSGQLLQPFEQAVIGLKPGESITVDIAAEDAYGVYREDLVFDISREQLEEGFDPEVGDTVYSQDESGYTWTMTVVAVSETAITVDANSALAGEDLTFKIDLLKIL